MDNYSDVSPEGYSSPLLPFQSQGQKHELDKERSETLQQLPVLKQVVKHLNDRIAATDSITQALSIADQYQIDRETALVALNIVKQQLEADRGYIQGRINRIA